MVNSCILPEDISNALRILDIDNQKELDEKTIVLIFSRLVEESIKERDYEMLSILVLAKNTLLAREIEIQLTTKKRYYLRIPIVEPCRECNGKGFKPVFGYDMLAISCFDCKGTGVLCRCRKCSGTGRIENLVCQKCSGTGKAMYRTMPKCEDCKGTGNKMKPINLGVIKEIITCPKCKGFGKRSGSVPVLSPDIAKKLR